MIFHSFLFTGQRGHCHLHAEVVLPCSDTAILKENVGGVIVICLKDEGTIKALFYHRNTDFSQTQQSLRFSVDEFNPLMVSDEHDHS